MATLAKEQPVPSPVSHSGIPRFAYATLGLLTLANVFNYVDRQILSILAQSIKADLHLDDAQLGFLMGTAFAVFYAVIGIAMGRISDGVSRKRLMAVGLAFWSAMTMLGGAASGFVTLGLARMGVGIGEATASPCSHSLLADSFPPRNRALALSVWLSGAFIGSMAALIVGGYFVQNWTQVCAIVPLAGACALPGWKATLIALGLPGLPIAVTLLFLREPPRAHCAAHAGRFVGTELAAAIPPLTLLTMARLGGRAGLLRNLAVAVGAAALAGVLTLLTGDWAQWAAAAIGLYAVVTWGQVQKYRDPALHGLTFGCPTFLLALCGSALVASIGGAVTAWSAPYAMRALGMTPVETGLSLGLINAAGAVLGLVVGGIVTDRWKLRDRAAPIWMAMVAAAGGGPCLLVMLNSGDVTHFLAASFAFNILISCWSGAFAALIQDMVLPRMRGAGSSAFSLFSIVVASGIGPYWAGKVSAITGSLRTGVLSMQLLVPVALVLLLLTARRLRAESHETRWERARTLGKPVKREG